ncbi:DUF2273 domain-containing protein [Alicyclobacillus sp.]|uniref:DUF2273 domain-containing protein n=1 Tax=Alicyclobacillus sp. TaxID=61169 RepID=UPI0025C17F19|nr:DUF2273 domain-containing protein [Alicyclobacillus sp.]MCL6516199.1 DUF2273 domain-containing protein [Alicyclobacillus sp.]
MTALREAWAWFRSLRRRWHGALAGVVLWAVWMAFGFWATILLVILCGGGFLAGRVLEQHESWRDVVEKLLAERFGDS